MVDISELPEEAEVAFLSRLAHELTVCARSTYEAGTENISEPKVLRAYNELQHRVTGSLRDHILGTKGIPVSAIHDMMREFGSQHNRVEEMDWALGRAFARTMSKGNAN
jgi:hypothetical protein